MKLRILHISDLHARASFPGMPASRGPQVAADAAERGIVLGESFREALRRLSLEPIDMVCFTGDLADWGQPEEYVAATKQIDMILSAVKVPRERFFAVRGRRTTVDPAHAAWGNTV